MVQETVQAAESAGVLGTLGINLKLFIAQLVNFGVVLFVMAKWVYKPMLKAMDERTAKIEKGLKAAEAGESVRAEAEKERLRLVSEARSQAKAIIEEAEASAVVRRDDMVKRAKTEVEKVVTDGKEAIRAEKEKMMLEVKGEAAELIASAAEKVLGEVVDSDKDRKLVAAAAKKAAAAL
ncbi:F0F1 ATP synthase subunit B [Candidatus Uhrbacteria bacterium]|nr:F0F1 ATP synthase subunit B [Candidatus Uhrbacteria bacterium]